MQKSLSRFLQSTRDPKDIVLLFLLVLILLWQPYYLRQQLNLFEWGLYLPGIEAVSGGQVPFRDFFHLRGPFELYVPALFMKMFGFRADVLATYFYLGTVLTMLAAVVIAYELIQQRFLLYSLVLVLVARTFPRVVFTFWGGMRYAWGLMGVWCLIRFFKTNRPGWLVAGGVLAAIGAWTSIEIGVSVLVAFTVLAVLSRELRRSARFFLAGFLLVSLPYGIYLLSQNALGAFLQAQWIVVTRMGKVFLHADPLPDTFPKLLHALLVPRDKNFHQMTPLYCYLGFLCLYLWRLRNKKITTIEQSVLAVAVYGLVIYTSGFRNLWASVFEMSLQPEKIVLFFLLGQLIVGIPQKSKNSPWGRILVLVAVILSSVTYSVSRFHKRFYVCSKKSMPLNGQRVSLIDLPRLRHMTIPAWQAEDLRQLKHFVDRHVGPHETVWMYPELGSLHFILQRPWVGRFPMATLSWMDEGWFAEYERDLESNPPRYAIVNKVMPLYFNKTYFPVPGNRLKHERMMQFLHKHYVLEASTPTYFVYRRVH